MTRNYQLMGEEFLRIGFSDANRAGHMVERYRRETGDKLPAFNAEAAAAVVRGKHLTVSVSERPFLQHMSSLDGFAKAIFLRAWQVVAAPVDTGFIICDYPFVVVPPINSPESIGFGLPGVVMYFPLTRRLCLRLNEEGPDLPHRSINKEEVRIMNQNIAVNSERFVMGASREQLERVIERSVTANVPPSRILIELQESDADSSLVKFTFWPIGRRFFYMNR